MTISHYTSKNRFLTCDVSDELIEICCKHILTLASFVAQKKLRAYDDGNSTFTSVENNNNAVWLINFMVKFHLEYEKA